MERSKFRTEHPQILGSTAQNLVTTATWHGGFVQPCTNIRIFLDLYVQRLKEQLEQLELESVRIRCRIRTV